MKTAALLLLLWSSVASAQITLGDQWTSEVITIKTDTMSVEKSFELLNKLCKGKMWAYDRKVIYKGETYFKFGLSRKSKIYKIEGNKMRRI